MQQVNERLVNVVAPISAACGCDQAAGELAHAKADAEYGQTDQDAAACGVGQELERDVVERARQRNADIELAQQERDT